MHKNIEHIFFDLDHTLWDFDKNSGLTFEKIFDIHDVDINLNEFLEVYEPINFKYWKLYREEKVTKTQLRYGRLNDAFTYLKFAAEDQLIHALSHDYIEYLTTFSHVFEGAHDVLEYLQTNYELHIITNGFEEAQERKMAASNLKSYFKTVTNSEMVGVKKPNPKIFNFALHQADARPQESIMIGDSIEADIGGAINVGMDAIYFDYSKSNIETDFKSIMHLSELKSMF